MIPVPYRGTGPALNDLTGGVDYLAFIAKDSAVWGKVIATGNIKADE